MNHISSVNINSISIKDLLIKYKIENLDLLYVDTEGYDGQIVNNFVSNFSLRSYIVFEYDNGRSKHRRWKVPLVQDHFILFSSHLNHYITKNENKDFLINLSLHFQLI